MKIIAAIATLALCAAAQSPNSQSAATQTSDAQSQPARQTPMPCPTDKRYRAFDFWVGDWEVVNTGDKQPAGTNRIELISDKCALYENWQSTATHAGKSITSYNPLLDKWQQFWTDNTGRVTLYTGNVTEKGLRFEADSRRGRIAMTFERVGNTVRQYGEQWDEKTKSWKISWDLLYRRK